MAGRTRKIISAVIAALMIMAAGGCGSSNKEIPSSADNSRYISETKDNGNVTDGKEYDIDNGGLPYDEETVYNQLFDINNKVEIDVDISDDELAKMQSDYNRYDNMGSKSPIYRKCDLKISITSDGVKNTYIIRNTGIRMKGNTSRTAFYDSNSGVYSLIHFKVDFTETFDDEQYYGGDSDYDLDIDKEKQQNRTFATLDSMEIKWNQTSDSTYVREYYACEMYRDFGILAQRTNLASINLGDVHEGIFKIYEPVDKKFIKRYVAEEDRGGDLYKCGWTRNGATFLTNVSYGIEDKENRKFYNYDLKTNKKTSTHESFLKLIRYLNGSNVDKEGLSEYIDMDYFLRFSAVSYFAGNPDDMRNDYNNYYIYFLKSSNKMIIIPYDNDRCFGITAQYNPSGDAMTGVKWESERAVGNGGLPQENPLVRYTITRIGFFTEEFKAELDKVADSEWLTYDKFSKIYEIAFNNYKDDTVPGKTMYNVYNFDYKFNIDKSSGLGSSNGNASFKDYIDAKLKFYNNNR